MFRVSLPTSPGDVTLTLVSIDNLAAQEAEDWKEVSAAVNQAAGRLWQLRRDAEAKEMEIAGLRARRSLIPEAADIRRNEIASELGMDIDRLRYAGELLQLKSEHRRWEKAVVGLLLPLSSTLLVDSREFTRVRRYVHDHDVRGSITIAPAVSGSPRPVPMDRGVPALLDVADHPFQVWLASELQTIHTQVDGFVLWSAHGDPGPVATDLCGPMRRPTS